MATTSNSSIILAVFGFYVFIIVMLGLIGSNVQANRTINTPEDPGPITFLSQIGFFFSGIGFALSNIGAWANTILFLPLGITLSYIGLSFFRGSS